MAVNTTLQDELDNIAAIADQVGEVYTAITGEVDNDATLTAAGFTNTSATAPERLWQLVFAFFSMFFQNYIFPAFQAQVQAIIDNNTNMNDRWWAQQLTQWQYGYSLLFNDTSKRPYYAPLDPTDLAAAQLLAPGVGYVAVVSSAGLCTVKVATSGHTPLTTPQLVSLQAYINEIQPSGANISAPISVAPDMIETPMMVYYDGTLNLAIVAPLVYAACVGYLENLPYNGRFTLNDYRNAIRAVAGVNDVVFNSLYGTVQAKSSLLGSTYIDASIGYSPYSGHIVVSADLPLATAVQFTAQ